MATCLLDTFAPACDAQNVVGGIFGKLYLAKRGDIATAAIVADAIPVITMVGATVFYEFTFVPEKSSQVTELTLSDGGANVYTSTLTGTLSANTPEALKWFKETAACKCGLVWVFSDANTQWITGLRNEGVIVNVGVGNNAGVTGGSFNTGDALTSANTSIITFTSINSEPPFETTEDMTTLI